MRILVTGARAPVALDLTRRLARAGHHVQVADSVAFPLAGFSRHARSAHRLPPPRQRPADFQRALAELVERERLDRVIPTCEEVLWVRRSSHGFGERVYAPQMGELIELHSKWAFSQLTSLAPPTWLVESSEQASAIPGELVFKPVFSRFGTETLIRPGRERLLKLAVSRQRPWVAQQFLAGTSLCSYSLAHAGRLSAHVTYVPRLRLNDGAGVVFESVQEPAVRAWVEELVGSRRLTGQLSFDFILGPQGLRVLECNPRATSGLHLFPDDERFCNALLENFSGACYEPPPGRRSMLTLAALYANPLGFCKLRARPVIWDRTDPLPFAAQALSFAPLWWTARRQRLSLLQATTYDINWDSPA